MDRVILHCDMNGFYASVELLTHPELRDVPMAVCGDAENRRGIILAKNELAKQYGVQTAETIWQAQRKCPGLRLVSPHRQAYRAYSQKANEIYRQFTDQVEPFGIDESWLDVTGSQALFGTGEEMGHRIRRLIKTELGLTVSVGVSFNKVFAKLGSDLQKPDAVTVISRENVESRIYPLDVSSLLYVGRNTEKTLKGAGIFTIGDLAKASPAMLERRLGKHGLQLSRYARGQDEDPVRRWDEPETVKSIGNSITFRRNLLGWEEIGKGVLSLSDSVGARLRAAGLKCAGVQVQIKDPGFHVIDRQQRLARPTNHTKELYREAMVLIKRNWNSEKPVRLLNVTALSLTPASMEEQLSLFQKPEEEKRLEALDHSMDELRGKFGALCLRPASLLKNDLGID